MSVGFNTLSRSNNPIHTEFILFSLFFYRNLIEVFLNFGEIGFAGSVSNIFLNVFYQYCSWIVHQFRDKYTISSAMGRNFFFFKLSLYNRTLTAQRNNRIPINIDTYAHTCTLILYSIRIQWKSFVFNIKWGSVQSHCKVKIGEHLFWVHKTLNFHSSQNSTKRMKVFFHYFSVRKTTPDDLKITCGHIIMTRIKCSFLFHFHSNYCCENDSQV